MRVDAKTKARTERRIKATADKLFSQIGLQKTTTRDIAQDAGIAVGTLFNYFPNKESLGVALIVPPLERAATEFQDSLRSDEPLEELLFSFIQCGLRHLQEQCAYAADVLEYVFHPLTQPGRDPLADFVRDLHAETVSAILARCGAQPASPMLMHLYWSLYLGIIRFWSQDRSENHGDTLALIDQATRLFAEAAAPVATRQENPR